MASEKKNSNKLNFLNWILAIAIVLFFGLLIIYYFNIFDLDTTKKSDWGTFGDFIGGTLNPIFALFSLFAIIYTIKIQTQELEFSREELEETRKELKESRIAQQEQSKSLILQNEATTQQIFEDTFFRMLETTNDLLSKFKIAGRRNNTKVILEYFISHIDSEEIVNIYREENNSSMKAYFMTLYQLLKFIDDSNIKQKKRYTNLIRVNMEDDVLYLLAITCIVNKYKKYKEYIEKYEFFEHLEGSDFNNLYLLKDKYLKQYNLKVFGKNERIIKYLNGDKEIVDEIESKLIF